jgi:hypothetical protein
MERMWYNSVGDGCGFAASAPASGVRAPEAFLGREGKISVK